MAGHSVRDHGHRNPEGDSTARNESGDLFRDTFDAMSAGIVVLSQEGRILLANQKWQLFAESNNVPATEGSEGAQYFAVCGRVLGIGDEQLNSFTAEIQTVLNGQSQAKTLTIPCQGDERKRWIQVRVTPFDTTATCRVLVVHEDTTEPAENEQRLRQSELFLESCFDAIQDGISVLDLELNIIRANKWMGQKYAAQMPIVGKKCYHVYQNRKSVCTWCPSTRAIACGEIQSEIVPYPSAEEPTGWIQLWAYPLKNDEGRVIGVIEHVQDITQRKLAEDALRVSEERLRILFERAADAIYVSKPDGKLVQVNAQACRATGYSEQELLHLNVTDVNARISTPQALRELFQTLHPEQPVTLESRHRRKDGTTYPVEITVACLDTPVDRYYMGIARDISKRKRAETIVRTIVEGTAGTTGVAFFRDLVRHIADALELRYTLIGELLEPEKTRIRVLAAWKSGPAESFEYGLAGTPCELVVRGESCLYRSGVRERFPQDAALQHMRAESYFGLCLYDSNGQPIGILAVLDDKPFEDVALLEPILRIFAARAAAELERRRAQQKLGRAQKLLVAAIESSPAGVLIADAPDVRIRVANTAALGIRGESHAPLAEIPYHLHPARWQVFHADGTPCQAEDLPLTRAVLYGETCRNREFIVRRSDGSDRWVLASAAPVRSPENEVIAGVVVFADVTEHKLAERALLRSEREYRELVESVNSIILRMDPLGNVSYLNEFAQEFFGYEESEIIGRSVVGTIVPETDSSGQDLRAMIEDIGKHPEAYAANENENLCKDGRRVWIVWTNKPIRSDDGQVKEILCVGNDITERRRLEDQLRQAQKLEAVGRLAGGVAHDFNNMLSVILGHAEMALADVDPSQSLRADLREIQKAAQRSADLTRQLLAFARKQTVSPKILDLNETVEGMLKMLRRLIGEDIDLTWAPGPRLWPVKTDPSQIDQILANLCVNARDAIKGVGRVTIATDNTRLDEMRGVHPMEMVPGEYVLLSVGDTGCGMSRETLAHLFEPFFTTKEAGEGTGLGLATVYGIVRQNDGFIDVASKPGQGTTFRIYLPRHLGSTEQLQSDGPAKPVSPGDETILFVEDEPAILKMGTAMLTKLGYRVLAAGSPAEAISLAERHAGIIHLLITDVVMPQMNGRELAGQLVSRYPEMKWLFVSGYTANVIAHHGVLDEGVPFLHKPFSVGTLAAKVRELLDSP